MYDTVQPFTLYQTLYPILWYSAPHSVRQNGFPFIIVLFMIEFKRPAYGAVSSATFRSRLPSSAPVDPVLLTLCPSVTCGRFPGVFPQIPIFFAVQEKSKYQFKYSRMLCVINSIFFGGGVK